MRLSNILLLTLQNFDVVFFIICTTSLEPNKSKINFHLSFYPFLMQRLFQV